MPSIVAARVTEARRRAGVLRGATVTLTEFAELVARQTGERPVPYAVVHGWEDDRPPTGGPILDAIARVGEVSPAWLAGVANAPEPEPVARRPGWGGVREPRKRF